ncbi:MAG TPA: [Ni/Fe] hydrogenase small subunit, partial [Candidatus Methylomirabilis sp.]|nr:[Ni/Fe] hydrogenase small subunit [Candidatus Methylomirabilis sp.]
PFYRRLPQVPGFGVETTADQIGVGLTVATGAAFAAHGILNIIRKKARGTQTGTGEEGSHAQDRH